MFKKGNELCFIDLNIAISQYLIKIRYNDYNEGLCVSCVSI